MGHGIEEHTTSKRSNARSAINTVQAKRGAVVTRTKTHKQSNVVRNINAILARNRNILVELNDKGKSFATRQQMTEKGFDFRYFTHVYKTKTGSVYYIVYDQAYLPKDGSPDSFLLVKFEEK